MTKFLTHSILALFIASTLAPLAAESDILPFDVTLGGEKAVLKKPSDIFGTVTVPVGQDATITIHDESEMVIINAFPCDQNGNPKDGAQPAIIMFQGKSSGLLSETLDQKPLSPGTYVANIVSNGRTSRIFFTVN